MAVKMERPHAAPLNAMSRREQTDAKHQLQQQNPRRKRLLLSGKPQPSTQETDASAAWKRMLCIRRGDKVCLANQLQKKHTRAALLAQGHSCKSWQPEIRSPTPLPHCLFQRCVAPVQTPAFEPVVARNVQCAMRHAEQCALSTSSDAALVAVPLGLCGGRKPLMSGSIERHPRSYGACRRRARPARRRHPGDASSER